MDVAKKSMNTSIVGDTEILDAYLKAALDFYVLGLVDFILAPINSFFSETAARRAFPRRTVLGRADQLCEVLRFYKLGANDTLYDTARSRERIQRLRTMEMCYDFDAKTLDGGGDMLDRYIGNLGSRARERKFP